MVDSTHPYFADSDAVAATLADLHPKLSSDVKPGDVSGTFESVFGKTKGYIVTPQSIAGVWADQGNDHRITRAVFYRVVGGEVMVEEFPDVDWSQSDLVEQGRAWLTP